MEFPSIWAPKSLMEVVANNLWQSRNVAHNTIQQYGENADMLYGCSVKSQQIFGKGLRVRRSTSDLSAPKRPFQRGIGTGCSTSMGEWEKK